MKTIQETNSGAHGCAETILQKHLGQVLEECQESELEVFSRFTNTDLALEYRPPRLELFSVKIREGV